MVPAWWVIIELAGDLVRQTVFDVATYRHLADEQVVRQPLSWLFDQRRRVQWARWRDTVNRIVAAEVGTGRALMAALGDAPDPLPSYDEVMERERAGAEEQQIPDWMIEFERVNKGRVIQTAKRSASSP